MTLVLAPAVGGSVAAWRQGDRELFRPATAEALAQGDPTGMASFPLVPFAGRIAKGAFTLGGKRVQLAPNLAGEDDTIHGQGWRGRWSVVAQGEAQARLAFAHPPGDWPWRYEAEQAFALEAGALVHEIRVTNLSDSPMPAGLGLHPYFPRDPDTRLKARVEAVFHDPAGPPAPPPRAWDWRTGPELPAFVDHQFDGWDGAATIAWPSRGRQIRMTVDPPGRRLVVYAPRAGDHVCVEPVSHQLDAVNRSEGGAGHGMTMLGPGESLSLTARFEVSPLETALPTRD